MNFTNAGADLIVNLLAGVVAAMLVLVFVERRRRPNLVIEIEENHPDFQGSIFLRVLVANERLHKPLALIYDREPALMCRAWISFHYPDGTRVYRDNMIARWAITPEPTSPFVEIQLLDGSRALFANKPDTRDWFDIAPGDKTELDIVRRFHGETDCYGWNNDGYAHNGKNPSWKLEKGRYVVKLRIRTGGRALTKSFQLINDADFRLENLGKRSFLRY